MASCCDDKACDVTALRESHGRVLWIVLGVNALMFVVEGTAGLLADSTSLLADSLDMLGDALVYAFSLFVLARSLRWQATTALAKGGFMAVDVTGFVRCQKQRRLSDLVRLAAALQRVEVAKQ